MNKEQFVALGLTEELATKAAAASTEELKGFVPKARFDEVNDAKKQAEKDRDKVSGQLEEVKKSAGDNDKLKAQIQTLQDENKAAKDKYESDAKELRLSTALKLSLAGKVHDPDIVAGLLDKTKIELDDAGAVKGGLDDQLKALQTSKAFLFIPEDKGGKPRFKGATPPESGGGGGAGGEKDGDFGKRLAEQGKVNEGLAKAQQSYFD
ncbi:phage scaffolding protein [Cohnella sp. GCM10012308]|uniref:phage scaffolding protein n=1 Tax=Cohnella sp. GCM10012308 TaxID=3317329 RepID=UPI0036242122